MDRTIQTLLLLGLLLLAIGISGCRNPFAPALGAARSAWTDQETVGGLLENFRMSYIRQDSLRYAECLACEAFSFNYLDTELGEYSTMPREVDLGATGRLFRHFNNVDLRWLGINEELASLETPDSLITFTVFFSLSLDVNTIDGHARFTVLRSSESDGCSGSPYEDQPVFRILQWDATL